MTAPPTRAHSATNAPAGRTIAHPPVSLPSFDRPLGPDALADGLRAFGTSYYAVHPFHEAMHEGRLSKAQLQAWVANRFCYQRTIPRKDAAILAACPDPDVRRRWIRRIADHDGAAPGEGGLERWLRLGEGIGVPRTEMLDGRHVLPGVRMAAESYLGFCRTHHWLEGVASSLTEMFAPDLMRTRIAAFERHYTWIPADALAYFRGRLDEAPRDSADALDILRERCVTVDLQRRAFGALSFKLEILWAMIDTIARAHPA